MKAAIIDKANSLHTGQTDIPVLSPGESLIRVKYAGICGSDLHILKGEHPTARFPVIPGHEFVGELAEVCGDNPQAIALGSTVVAQPYYSCGTCAPCAKGQDNVCEHLRLMGAHCDGGFAEYVKVPTRKVYAYPDDIDLRVAALTEPVAVGVQDVRRSGLQVGQTVLVIGGGPIGLIIALIARLAGAVQVVISEISAYRCEAAGQLGFQTVNPLSETFDAQLMELSGGKGFDVVFEVSGSKAGVLSATQYCKIAGTVVAVGMTAGCVPVDLPAVFAKELVIMGTRIHSQYSFLGAVELIRSGVLNEAFSTLISAEYSLTEIEEAFQYALTEKNYMKILVKC